MGACVALCRAVCRFVVKEGKDPIPVIHISAITGITTEITEGRKR